MPLAGQLVHHRSAHPGPLVLGATPLNSPARTLDRDRTVSQRSEPSSRTALMGEQPNPWEVLPPQDATSRHRAISAVTGGADYLSTFLTSERRCRRLIVTTDSLPQKQITISPLSNESGSVVTGSCRELVSEVWQDQRFDEPPESLDALHRDADAVIGLVAIQRASNVPLIFQHAQKASLII